MGLIRSPIFQDRSVAGAKLAETIENSGIKNPVILALPRGGAVVADEIGKRLGVRVDVVLSRKIGAPGFPEYGIGAIAEGDEVYFSPISEDYYHTDSPLVEEIVENERFELKRRMKLYRSGHGLTNISGRVVIVVDDGLATGVTAIAAAKFLRTLHPEKLILAVPVGPDEYPEDLKKYYDEIICLHRISDLRSIGLWYESFDQVDDQQVVSILKKYH